MPAKLNKWYFVNEEGTKEGPVSKETLFSLLASGRISINTLVWTLGMKKYKAMSEVFEENQTLIPSPPQKVNSNIQQQVYINYSGNKTLENPDESKKFLGGIYHPWRRFFARWIDLFLIWLLMFEGFPVIIIYMHLWSFKYIYENILITCIIWIVVWLQIEASLLSTIGTTPGKWLFGISITTDTDKKMTFGQSILRTFLIFFQGFGLGIPIISLFTEYFAYRRLTKTGTTLWDDNVGCVVSHKRWGFLRAIICTFIVFFFIILFSAIMDSSRSGK